MTDQSKRTCPPTCQCHGTGYVERGPAGATYSYPCYPWDCQIPNCACKASSEAASSCSGARSQSVATPTTRAAATAPPVDRVEKLEAALRHIVVVSSLAKWNTNARLAEIRRKATTALGVRRHEYDEELGPQR